MTLDLTFASRVQANGVPAIQVLSKSSSRNAVQWASLPQQGQVLLSCVKEASKREEAGIPVSMTRRQPKNSSILIGIASSKVVKCLANSGA